MIPAFEGGYRFSREVMLKDLPREIMKYNFPREMTSLRSEGMVSDKTPALWRGDWYIIPSQDRQVPMSPWLGPRWQHLPFQSVVATSLFPARSSISLNCGYLCFMYKDNLPKRQKGM